MNGIRRLKGANMDVDLVSEAEKIHWKQDECPWNVKGKTKKYKCAEKNISLCKYFRGIEYPDTVLCNFGK